MPYRVLALDYDGTIAQNGVVSPDTVAALAALRAAGVRLVLVTGRQAQDFDGSGGASIFPWITNFDRVVTEDGAVMWDPATGRTDLLGAAVGDAVVAAALAAGVRGVWVGRAMVSIRRDQQAVMDQVVRDNGFPLHGIPNGAWVNYVSPWIDKAVGFEAALAALSVRAADAVAAGDGENDVVMLRAAGLGVTFSGAHREAVAAAALVTAQSGPAGVRELIAAWLGRRLRAERAIG